MTERERKMLAFISGMIQRLVIQGNVTFTLNDMQQLDNIVSELGYYDLDETEFRW